MKTHTFEAKTSLILLLAISTVAALVFVALRETPRRPEAATVRETGSPENAPRTTAQVRGAYGQIPLSFEANRGQADEAIDFRARGAGFTLSLSPTEARFLFARGTDEAAPALQRMNLVGANPSATVEGLNELEGKINYLLGNDPAQWRTGIPTFSRVRYSEVYPGIDVVYHGNQRRLEYDFVIAPGRDARAIALEFDGVESVQVEAVTGDLLLGVGENTIRQHKPIVYQEFGDGRHEVESRYTLQSGGRIGFEVGEYDPNAALIIDPVLEYSTYLSGSSDDLGFAIAVDSAGNAYITGVAGSTNFPTADPLQSARGGDTDAFVTKLNSAGSALVYSTYLGGSGDESGEDIAVDSAGNAYLIGFTDSTNFPTANALQSTKGGNEDAFVTKLNSTGSALIYSTYLGGTETEVGFGIAVDSAGNAYVTGSTFSTDFPTANAFQSTNGGVSEREDGFVSKLNAAGSALVYSTYLGGSRNDRSREIAVDSAGNAYVTGQTFSTDFPIANAFQGTKGSGNNYDVFVTKLNAAGSALVYSTYLGGSSYDSARGIAVDSAGNAYLTGDTASDNYPTANAFQGARGGDIDAFVTKLNAAGSALVYSTYLGGGGTSSFVFAESGSGIAVDSAGNAYVTGGTDSTDFPTTNAFQSTIGGGESDAFVTKFNAAGSALVYSTYLGGSGGDFGGGIAVDFAGDAYVAGYTDSTNFPTTTGAFDTTSGGDRDAFISKISDKPSQLLNIATRMRVLTGDSALIGGFIITGNDPKRIIIRGIGPSTNIPGALANPTLELFDSNQVLLGNNDDWITIRAEVEATTIPPTNDLESAIVITLAPGAYTAVLRGQNNGVGIGVVEVYDLNAAVNSTLANISSRGFVDTGDNAMIGGFIVGGGSSATRVLVRGIGPSLSAFFPNPLENPTLELRNADGSLIRENDDWRDSQETEIQDTTIPPSNNLESAIIASVGNGNYTAILRGVNNTTGVAVVEVYNLE